MKIGHFIPSYRKWIHIEACYSLARDLQYCGMAGHDFMPFYIASCNVAAARNQAVKAANVAGCDYLLMCDADCFVLPGQGSGLRRLLEVLENNPSAVAAAFAFATRDERTNAEPAQPDSVVAGEVGTGYMLIDMRLIRQWQSAEANRDVPLFAVETTANGTAIVCGEDIYFCRTMSAAGYDVMIDSTLATGHSDERSLLVLPTQNDASMKATVNTEPDAVTAADNAGR